MPSKGLDYYFINESSYTLNANAKNADDSYAMGPLALNTSSSFTTGHAEIDTDIPFHVTGSAEWSATTQPPQSAKVDINGLTGNASDVTGNLCEMMQTPSVTTSQFALSYGFYDAGSGTGTGLTNHDRMYAYLTPSKQAWMGDLVRNNPAVGTAPFSSFVLPGAHDSGTFDLGPIKELETGGAFAALVASLLLWVPGISILAFPQALRVVTGLSVTQKDNITAMLNLGCRHFDFRPGYTPTALRTFLPDIYHIHTVIPGYKFLDFLKDVLTWLQANTTEIVVINLSSSGFQSDDMIPDANTLQGIFNQAVSDVGGDSIGIGSAADLASGQTYNQLIQSNTRLFFLNAGNLNWFPARKYDSYSDSAYATADPQSIITALNGMNSAGQTGNDFTVLQLQGTATNQNTTAIVASLIASLSNATSPLMSTKAYFDSTLYPLVPSVAGNLSNTNLLVLLNDFIDNKLASVASALTLQRATAAQPPRSAELETAMAE